MANETGKQAEQAPSGDFGHFQWHPTYNGRAHAEVQRELANEIARDQRAYSLAMEGAEANEHDSLASVIDLDRKWSDFDLGWAEANPEALASRIVAFEAERDRRHELIPWRDYREAGLPVTNQVATAAGVAGMPWLWVIVALIALIIIVIVIVAVT